VPSGRSAPAWGCDRCAHEAKLALYQVHTVAEGTDAQAHVILAGV
jgi:hypothetical protein